MDFILYLIRYDDPIEDGTFIGKGYAKDKMHMRSVVNN